MAYVAQRVSNWLLGEYPVRTTAISGVLQPEVAPPANTLLLQHVVPVDEDDNVITGGTPSPVSAVVTEAVIAVGIASTAVLAANSTRNGGWAKNIADAYIWVSLSGTATAAKPSRLGPGEVLPFLWSGVVYTGAVSAIQTTGATLDLEVVEL